MIASFLFLLPFLQDTLPAEEHCWLRWKTGTWVKSVITIEDGGRTDQGIQTLTLKERDGDKYVIEEASTLSLGPKTLNRTAAAVKTGKAEVTIQGKPVACTIWTATGERNGSATETRYWIPDGRKDPVRVAFRQDGVEGEMTAVSLKETLKVGDRTFSCVKLEGKVATVRGRGPMTAWTTNDIPGGQVRMDLALDTPAGGKVTFKVEAAEIHEAP